MTLFKLFFIVSCAVYLLGANAEISDKRLCADKDCSEPISTARTLLKYAASEKGMLSFGPNEVLTVYSKAAGRNMGVWGAEHKGKRGYIPISFIREEKVFKKDISFLVDTEFVNKEVPSDNLVPPIKVEPDKPDTVVVDGTTIYNGDIEISSPVKDSSVVPTALPQETVKVDQDKQAQVEPETTVDSKEHGVNQNSSVPDQNDDEFEEEDDEYGVIIEEYSDEEEESIEDIDVTADKDNNLSTGDVPVSTSTNSTEPDTVVNATEPEKPQSLPQANESEPETKKMLPVFEELLKPETETSEATTVKPEYDEIEYTKSDADVDNTKENVSTTASFYDIANNISSSGGVEAENVTTGEPLSTGNDNESSEKVTVEESKVTEKYSPDDTAEGLRVLEKTSTDNTVEGLGKEHGFYKPFVTSFYPRAEELRADPQSDNSVEMPEATLSLKVSDHQQPKVNIPDYQQVNAQTDIPPSTFSDYNQQQTNDSPNLDQEKSETGVPPSTSPDYRQPSGENDDDLKAATTTREENEDNLKTETTATSPDYQQPSGENEDNSKTAIPNTPGIAEIPNLQVDEPSVIESPVEETAANNEVTEEIESQEEQGIFSSLLAMVFGESEDKDVMKMEGAGGYVEQNDDVLLSRINDHANSCTMDPSGEYCAKEEKPIIKESFTDSNAQEEETFVDTVDLHDLLKLLGVSGATIVVFLWGYIIIDKMRKEGPLIAKINNLEQALLVTTKENQILTEKLNENDVTSKDNTISNEMIEELKAELEGSNSIRAGLEEQIQCLEKELENSTEVGLELNRMLSDVLNSQNGSDAFMSNIEQLQSKLVDQQSTINTINASLSEKETANHELQLELEINNKKVIDLQAELDKMVENLLKIEEEKDCSQNKYENQIHSLKQAAITAKQSCDVELNSLRNELGDAQRKLKETQRSLELKNNEYNLLKDNVKTIGSDNDIRSLLDANSIKAEMQQLQQEKVVLAEHLQQHQQLISNFESQVANMGQDLKVYREKYEEADREKVQVITKLDVLNSYFKEKEAELQKEIAKHESMWMERQGEASSTVGRIKFMQEEIQNFKAQNESLKQEIVSQEVELKSQISVLEKKAHESWVAARQAERKLEDVKQEAATLRNRLTLRERSINEDKSLNRLQSPLESNGDHPLSPLHMNVESPASPPLLYGTRDHLTTSPPLPGLPPFLPPPPGVPFIPPPIPGIPPFMPPPPSMFPGDHRPPPLGRMSSPPLNSRYSPDSRPYLHYDRNSPSPTDDEYYGISHRGYSPYNGRDNRRDYGRSSHRSNNKKGGGSSGSGNSNDSLDKINRHNSKV